MGESDGNSICVAVDCKCFFPSNVYHNSCISEWIGAQKEKALELKVKKEDPVCPICQSTIQGSSFFRSQDKKLKAEFKPSRSHFYHGRSEAALRLQLRNTVQFCTIDHPESWLDESHRIPESEARRLQYRSEARIRVREATEAVDAAEAAVARAAVARARVRSLPFARLP